MIKEEISFLPFGSLKYSGIIKKCFDFVDEEQLLRKDVWDSFVRVFKERPDGNDMFWRGEFFGKMMRGACLCYEYENDEKLYNILKETCLNLIKTQDELGRISSYPVEKEFDGWDMWSRKYVMTGLIHFYHICHEDDVKEIILSALIKHADYIVDHVGDKENQKPITKTSEWWLGVNSCSILEPFMALYRISKLDRYLEFSKYIVETGGIREGNLINLVKEDKLLPYQFPEAKAYETMSFFEGVLDYAEVTDNYELKDICIKFFDDVNKSDISITGNAGAEEEIFNNASITQTIKPPKFNQETCVSVTWMRVNTKLYLLTGEEKYYERLELTARNAFLGSLNFYHQSAWDWFGKKAIEYLPFDSYSPLRNDKRGKSTGGLCYLNYEVSHYGCCACIGSASVGLTALNTIVNKGDQLVINDYYQGEVNLDKLNIKINETMLKDGKVNLTFVSEDNKEVLLRVPSWSNDPYLIVNGLRLDLTKGDYQLISLAKGTTSIELFLNPKLKEVEINNLIALTYGSIVLAIEEENNPDLVLEDLKYSKIKDIELVDAYKDEYQLLFKGKYNDKEIYLKDYASAGKRWDIPRNKLTVFIDK